MEGQWLPCSCCFGSRESFSCRCPGAAAAIAQLGKRQTEDLKVPGSIPGLGTAFSRVASDRVPASVHRAAPGIEPGTSCTRNENHATRPSSQLLIIGVAPQLPLLRCDLTCLSRCPAGRVGSHGAAPGIEPGTSRTLSENHATRPSSRMPTPLVQRGKRSVLRSLRRKNSSSSEAIHLARIELATFSVLG